MYKDEQILEKRLLELSRLAYQRNIISYTDFLNLNELHILHSLPKVSLYSGYLTFGGYEEAERQMAAFLPDALSLRGETDLDSLFGKEICALCIRPLHEKYAESLTHRDYLGALLNLGIDRSKIGDILTGERETYVFVKPKICDFLKNEMTKVRHTFVRVSDAPLTEFHYEPHFDIIKGTVSSLRLDSLLALAFSASRSSLTGLIEGGKVFVNGKLITSNSYQIRENDIISVRGLGKFRFSESGNLTRKNRLFVEIKKYK